MLYGAISLDQLYFDYPDWQQIEKQYKPSLKIINQFSRNMDSISVDIFLGTWCSDSKREVPAFFKVIHDAKLSDTIKINIWAVNRSKKLDNGLAQECNIELVPTFIFYRANREIGRIVEMPDGLLEEDMLTILQSDE